VVGSGRFQWGVEGGSIWSIFFGLSGDAVGYECDEDVVIFIVALQESGLMRPRWHC
jgi:hypothetical protein